MYATKDGAVKSGSENVIHCSTYGNLVASFGNFVHKNLKI